MTADWLAAVSVLADPGLANAEHVSVFGMSMGARFGLPAAAALGPSLQCAVLGKFGIRQSVPLHPGLCAPGRGRAHRQIVMEVLLSERMRPQRPGAVPRDEEPCDLQVTLLPGRP